MGGVGRDAIERIGCMLSDRRFFVAFAVGLGAAVLAGFVVVLVAGGGLSFGGSEEERTPSAQSSGTASASPSPTSTAQALPTRTATAQPVPTASPTATEAASTAPPATATATAPATESPTGTASPTSTRTATPTATPTPTPTPTPTGTPSPTALAGPPPTPTAAATPSVDVTGEPFTGTWRIVDTVTSGSGTGSVFTFDVVITQTGPVLQGGSAAIQLTGTVDGTVAQVQFTQPAQGYTGTFSWDLVSPDRAAGTFSTAGLNSGFSELLRLD